MKPVLVVKTGCTLESLRARRGDYEDWIAEGLGVARAALEVVPVHEGAALPAPGSVAAVVVTGSAAMVSDREPWSEAAARWLGGAVAARTPLLGICYGHQLLAHGLGGRVGPNPRGREIGTVAVAPSAAAASDPLLGPLRDSVTFQATHLESVLELPPGATALAATPLDPFAAFAVGPRAWGVQFHPEFDDEVMRAYLDARREILRAEGLVPEVLERAVAATPEGPRLLRRFAVLAGLARRPSR